MKIAPEEIICSITMLDIRCAPERRIDKEESSALLVQFGALSMQVADRSVAHNVILAVVLILAAPFVWPRCKQLEGDNHDRYNGHHQDWLLPIVGWLEETIYIQLHENSSGGLFSKEWVLLERLGIEKGKPIEGKRAVSINAAIRWP